MTRSGRAFAWHEYIGAEPAEVCKFYARAVGWDTTMTSIGGIPYPMLRANGVAVAAVVDPAPAADAPRGWVGYVQVWNIDDAVDRVVRLGGKIRLPAEDVPAIGRFAVLADPQGADFGLFSKYSGEPSGDTQAGAPGHVGWHELYCADPGSSIEFYVAALGWEAEQVIEMGLAGRYHLFSVAGRPAGGIMKSAPGFPACGWSPFFEVLGIESAEQRVTDRGGRVADGLRDVPGGSCTVKGADPWGASFALTGRRD